jgi:hypothetical protein
MADNPKIPFSDDKIINDLAGDSWLNPFDGPLKPRRENPNDPESPWLIYVT